MYPSSLHQRDAPTGAASSSITCINVIRLPAANTGQALPMDHVCLAATPGPTLPVTIISALTLPLSADPANSTGHRLDITIRWLTVYWSLTTHLTSDWCSIHRAGQSTGPATRQHRMLVSAQCVTCTNKHR